MPTKTDIPKTLTTEQLGEALLRDIKQMSHEEKAEVRKQLDKAFKKN
jgi:hypothetical protein